MSVAANQGVAPAGTISTLSVGGGGQATASNVAQAPTATPNNQTSTVTGTSQNATNVTNTAHYPAGRKANPWAPQWQDPDTIPATSQTGFPEGPEPGLSVDYRFGGSRELPHLTFDVSTL